MKIGSLAAVLLLSTLAVAGCMGGYPGALGGYGSGYASGGYGGGYGGAGGYQGGCVPQPYGLDPGFGGAYGGAYGQSYQQPYQGYGYYGPNGYVYQPGQVPNGTNSQHASVNQRLQTQDSRIQKLLDSGQLTPEEYQRLQDQQKRIQDARTQMRSDGKLTAQERARLDTMLDRSNHQINRLGRNGQRVADGQTTQANTALQTNRQLRANQANTALQNNRQLRANPLAGAMAPARGPMQARSMAQARPLTQARPMMQARPAAQSRPAAAGRATRGGTL
jgi:hypothetical protein